MKTRQIGAALLCLATAGVAFGDVVSVTHDTSKSGFLNSAAGGYETTAGSGTYGFVTTIGDFYGGFDYALGVLKYQLPAAIGPSDTINSATLLFPSNYSKNDSNAATVFIKVQRYAANNDTGLMSTDHPDNATLIDVGVTSIIANGPFSLDLTAAVAADVAAGKTYTSYLLTAVQDAAGTPLADGAQDDLYYAGLIAGGEQFTINYTPVPEPAALTLLGLGLLTTRGRRR